MCAVHGPRPRLVDSPVDDVGGEREKGARLLAAEAHRGEGCGRAAQQLARRQRADPRFEPADDGARGRARKLLRHDDACEAREPRRLTPDAGKPEFGIGAREIGILRPSTSRAGASEVSGRGVAATGTGVRMGVPASSLSARERGSGFR